jgi:hypothetical protein
MAEASKKMVTQLPPRGPGQRLVGTKKRFEMLRLFSSPHAIVRRRLADGDGIGPRKSFLKGLIEQPVEPALLFRDRDNGHGRGVFVVVFHGQAPWPELTPCPP